MILYIDVPDSADAIADALERRFPQWAVAPLSQTRLACQGTDEEQGQALLAYVDGWTDRATVRLAFRSGRVHGDTIVRPTLELGDGRFYVFPVGGYRVPALQDSRDTGFSAPLPYDHTEHLSTTADVAYLRRLRETGE